MRLWAATRFLLLIATGPEGDFYLSQQSSGQADDSPCIDTGSDQAANICFEGPNGETCMNNLWTRTDEAVDSGVADIGFHYGASLLPSPTPTSSPTITPTPTKTPTATCTSTPSTTPEPTNTPVPPPIPALNHSGKIISVILISLALFSLRRLILNKN